MKKITSLILSLLMCVCVLSFSVSAQNPNIADNADLLTTQEELLLETTTDVIRDDYDFDVVILTVSSTQGEAVEAFADDYYDYNGYGVDSQRSGVLFLVSMEDRDWFISTRGRGIDLISDGEIDYIEQEIIPYLSEGDYAVCFSEFLSVCKEILELDADSEEFSDYYGYDTENDYFFAGNSYDDGYSNPKSFNFFKNALIAFAVGFIIALIVVLNMKSKLKPGRAKSGAADYVVAGSMNLTHSHERFLYRHVTRTPRQQNNSNGRSGGGGVRVGSSGASHGGRGGKF